MKIEEQEIPSLIRQGKDRVVIPLLYKILFPKVKAYILRNRGSKEDAADVFQDAVLLFYTQVVENKFNDKYTVYGYVYRLSINRWLNKIRKDKKLVFVEGLQDEEDREPDERADMRALNVLLNHENVLRKLFSGIGEKCIEILTYTIYYNLMLEDIVLRMGFISEGAVKMQLKRCKGKLYKEIEKDPSLIEKLKGNE